MQVIKKSGNSELYDERKMLNHITASRLGRNIDPAKVIEDLRLSVTDGMTTGDITELMIDAMNGMIDVDTPDYTYTAANILYFQYCHNVSRTYGVKAKSDDIYDAISLSMYYKKLAPALAMSKYKLKSYDLIELNSYIDRSRDYQYTYLGMKSLMERYVLSNQYRNTELIQHYFMSLAIWAASAEIPKDRMYWTKKFYDVISKGEFLPGTPSLSNGRLKIANIFSCATMKIPDDANGIADSLKKIIIGSKFGTGFGGALQMLRGRGAPISGNLNAATGPLPQMKIIDSVISGYNQLGVRSGSFNGYNVAWHIGIIEHIDCKKHNQDDEVKMNRLTLSIGWPDIFMRRKEVDGYVVLFDPYDCPELVDTYGTEFDKYYEMYEEKFYSGTKVFNNPPKVVKVKNLFNKAAKVYAEEGQPFFIYPDNVNNSINPSKEQGICLCPNLCVEYFTTIIDNEVPVCNLGSVNLSKVGIDDIDRVTRVGGRFLDNIIDLADYVVEGSKQTQYERRSVGMGIAGEGEAIANLGIMYGSAEHAVWIDEIYSAWAKASDDVSRELAIERGPCTIPGRVSEFRNAYRRCIAPTSGIAILMDTTYSIEPVTDRVWVEDNKLGKHRSVAPKINISNYNFYIPAHEVDQFRAVELTGKHRQPWVDMGISHNIWISSDWTELEDLEILLTNAWNVGMKSTYYIRTEGTSGIINEGCVSCQN